MDNNFYRNQALLTAGIPYDEINWFDIEGQPFGIASQFNAIIFNDANNIIDTKGAMAVGGNFTSPRGLTLGYGRDPRFAEREYSPDLVRFLVGGNVSMNGPLVVVGHVVVGGNFRAAKGSTYLIGKDNTGTQIEELDYLYQAPSGSSYWIPTDKGNHYLISSYDVPRYIPAGRIDANLPAFFQNARDSIGFYKECIEDLNVNGTVVDNFHEWILRGNDPQQNVFLIDVRPNGRLNKGIRAEVPEGSLVIVRLRTGNNAHLQYGLLGEERLARRTLYVFEDANEIFMEVPAAIWGSVLAPQAMFHAHSTGGHISGNAAFRSFAVSANSGFEFHSYPFVGGVFCAGLLPALPEIIPEIPVEVPEVIEECPECPVCPGPQPCPEAPPCPAQEECPVPPPCPAQEECPVPPPCPVQEECPMPPPCPVQEECPMPPPCPVQEECPICPPQEVCPIPLPCPECQECPTCPEQEACPIPRPCPIQEDCPTCPPCPGQKACPICPEQKAEFIPFPVPIPYRVKQVEKPCPECPECEECLVTPGIIFGCIEGCYCCKSHEWEVSLYRICGETKILVCSDTLCCGGCFEFDVPYNGSYLLKVCPSRYYRKSRMCKPYISLKNVGVAKFMIE